MKLQSLKHRFGGIHYQRLKYLAQYIKSHDNNIVLKEYYKFLKYKFWRGYTKVYHKAFPDSNANDYVEIGDYRLPSIDTRAAEAFWLEFPDLLLPYNCDDEFDLSLFYNEGPYELHGANLSQGDIVIDCGANMGCFSAVASCKAQTVYAFEPDPYIADHYLGVTTKYSPNIRIENYALGKAEGKARFESNIENMGGGKVVDNSDSGSYEVNVISLDQFVRDNQIEKVDYIKADIEGAERDMLSGATEVLKRFAPKLSICTYHLSDDKEVLENIVRTANPHYEIKHDYKKMYAYVPREFK